MDKKAKQLSLLDGIELSDLCEFAPPVIEWPDSKRYPHNWAGNTTEDLIIPDLLNSESPLIVTGYASLDRVIDFIADGANSENPQSFRVVFGSEPFEAKQKNLTLKGQEFPNEVHEYWMEQGFSLFYSAKIIKAIQLLEAGRVKPRYLGTQSRKLHAKIYVGDQAATMGSSNFTHTGLRTQLEANVRFSKSADRIRYREASLIAENFWNLGRDYSKELLDLLRQMLKVVSWQEALARACAELLEGEWAAKYIDFQTSTDQPQLWPSQVIGIARAMWIVETVGSVLVADATGSGKTKMGVHLIRSMINLAWSKGRARISKGKDLAVLIAPPSIESAWINEATKCGVSVQVRPNSVLSIDNGKNTEESLLAVRRAQILALDEAHNYLNLKSRRSQRLLTNQADHVVLFTATPINRNTLDLLSLIDWLGADNLDDETLDVLFKYLRGKSSGLKTLSHSETAALKNAIQQVTVRRTKRALNEMIGKNPRAYLDGSGRMCQYPEHRPKIYHLPSPAKDLELASRIRALASTFYGTWLLGSSFKKPEGLLQPGFSESSFAARRLKSSSALALHSVMAALRSSRAALYELLYGTHAAHKHYGVKNAEAKKHATGNAFTRIRDTKGRGPPKWYLECEPPAFLASKEAFDKACDHDLRICADIMVLLMQMGPSREEGKARAIVSAFEQNKRLLVFDSTLITLDVIKIELKKVMPPELIRVVSGINKPGREKLQTIFSRTSEEHCVALCSDAMSESVNLQGASAVLLLDMPSVVRTAEQRIGRVDRLDSPYKSIEVWWPADPPEFAVRKRERIVQRLDVVKELIGSNIELPERLVEEGGDDILTVEEAITEAANSLEDGLLEVSDALTQVNNLVQGETKLVPTEIYETYKLVSGRVLSRVSLVRAKHPWAFFCVKGALNGAPRWILFTGVNETPHVRVDVISSRLRILLNEETESRPLDDRSAEILSNFLLKTQTLEPLLLPQKKQRALQQMREVLAFYSQRASRDGDSTSAKRWNALASVVSVQANSGTIDMEAIADNWLELVHPFLIRRVRARGKGGKPMLIRDITQDVIQANLDIYDVERRFESIPTIEPIDRRVVACILGVN